MHIKEEKFHILKFLNSKIINKWLPMLNVNIVVENVGDVFEHGYLVSFVFVLIIHIKRLNKVKSIYNK